MAKRGLGKTSGPQGSRPDTLDPVSDEEARTGRVPRAPARSSLADAEPLAGAAAPDQEAQELRELLAQPQAPAAEETRLLTDFFSLPPPAPEPEDLDPEPVPVARAPRAMWLSLGMLGVSIMAIGSYLAYQELYVPQAVELGSDEPVLVLEGPIAAGLPGEPAQAEAPAAVSGERADADALRSAADEQLPAPDAKPEPAPAEPVAVPVDALALAEPSRVVGTSAPASASPRGSENATPIAAQPLAADPSSLARASAAKEADSVPQLGASEAPGAPVAQPAAAAAAAPTAPQPTAADEASVIAAAGAALAVDRAPLAAAGAAPAPDSVTLAPTGEPVQSFDALLEQAEGLSRRGQSTQAVAAFERALQRQPGAPAALAGKAYAYLNLNDQHAAKALAEQAVAADPTSSRGWIVLGAAEEQLGSRSAAQAAYRQCAERGVGHYVDECRKLVR